MHNLITKGETTAATAHPTARLIEALAGRAAGGVAGLLQAVATAAAGLPGALRVAAACDPEHARLLDPDWQAGTWFWLGPAAGSDGAAAEPAGGWAAVERVVAGRDHGPGLPGAVDGAVWRGRAAEVRDRATLAVLVQTDENLAPRRAAELLVHAGELAAAAALLAGLRAENRSLRAELDRIGGESHAMSRLNRLQGRFVAMASHEFKAPLTSITAYADVLKAQVGNDGFPHAHEFLDVIRVEANRLLRMVNRILDFTRMEYGSRLMACEPVAMLPLVQEAVRAMAAATAEKGQTVEIVAPGHLPRAEVDPDLIRQVLVNLLSNALKFTPQGGRVTVTLSEQESAVAVSVADDGPGIPAEDIHRIFREFYRSDGTASQAEGTGLGLTIARHIIHLHGGHIEALRRAEGGSDFRFLVPKEAGAFASLPQVLRKVIAPADAARLTGALLRTVAELTGSRAAALFLRDGQGALVPVGTMGQETDAAQLRPVLENEAWTRFLGGGTAAVAAGPLARDLQLAAADGGPLLACPLGRGDNVLGVIAVGRRDGSASYGAEDLVQMGVLAEVVQRALESADVDVARTCEALQVLMQIRRAGVPTSTPAALDLANRLGLALDLGDGERRRLLYAATLHDAGMARVEDEIVFGAAPLSWDERDEVDRHVEQGVDLLKPLLPSEKVREIIRHHHERWDGSGHPAGLSGEGIPVGARILAVVDAWFSLTQGRPYRAGMSRTDALTEIEANAGRQFDPRLVAELHSIVGDDRRDGPGNPADTNPADAGS